MSTPFLFTVKLGLSGLPPSELVERGRNHVANMTGNPAYPTPTPSLATITTACDLLEAADLEVARNGGKLDHLARRERMKELHALIKELAGYVQAASGGDPEKIASAAFQTRRSPQPIGQVKAPGNLRARSTDMPGEISLRWDRVKGRMIYLIYSCQDDPLVDTNWKQIALFSRNFHTVHALESGKAYSFRVVAVGTSGPGPASDPATAKPR